MINPGRILGQIRQELVAFLARNQDRAYSGSFDPQAWLDDLEFQISSVAARSIAEHHPCPDLPDQDEHLLASGGRIFGASLQNRDCAILNRKQLCWLAHQATRRGMGVPTQVLELAVEAGLFGPTMDKFTLDTMGAALDILASVVFISDWKIIGAYYILKKLVDDERNKFESQQGKDRVEDPDPYRALDSNQAGNQG